jgi:hypothetical protein
VQDNHYVKIQVVGGHKDLVQAFCRDFLVPRMKDPSCEAFRLEVVGMVVVDILVVAP